jgi:hypothetical protein
MSVASVQPDVQVCFGVGVRLIGNIPDRPSRSRCKGKSIGVRN